jgi:hypothetical protein
MLKRLKIYASKWLGVTELQQKLDALIICYDIHTKEINQLMESEPEPEHTGGSVQAKGRVDYAPTQTGNVIVAEPKVLRRY